MRLEGERRLTVTGSPRVGRGLRLVSASNAPAIKADDSRDEANISRQALLIVAIRSGGLHVPLLLPFSSLLFM